MIPLLARSRASRVGISVVYLRKRATLIGETEEDEARPGALTALGQNVAVDLARRGTLLDWASSWLSQGHFVRRACWIYTLLACGGAASHQK